MARVNAAHIAIGLWLVTTCAAPAYGLSLEETALVAAVRAREAEALQLLEQLVDRNSGSRNLRGISQVRQRVTRALRSLRFRVQLIDPEPVRITDVDTALNMVVREIRHGRHLVATRHAGKGRPRILVFGHLDTIFEADHPFQGFERDEARLYGPGVIDDKGGIAVLWMALAGLQAEGLLASMNLIVVLNGDEEIGSLSSRSLFEQRAPSVDYALGLEPGQLRDGMSTIVQGRKGVGFYRVYVLGKAAHAGTSYHLGLNAFEELAHKTVHMQQLTDDRTGVTVNVGGEVVVRDSKRNTIPHWAQAEIDVRFGSPAEGEDTEARLRAIVEHAYITNPVAKESARAVMLGGIVRPPWPANGAGEALAAVYCQVAKELGREVVPEFRGGGSDGNFLAALGVPTVDGLGIVGGGSHTAKEYALASSLSQRAEQLAVFLWRLSSSSIMEPHGQSP